MGKRMKWKKKNEKITPLGSLKVCANIYEIWMLVTQGGRKLWNFGWELGAIELESMPTMIKKKGCLKYSKKKFLLIKWTFINWLLIESKIFY